MYEMGRRGTVIGADSLIPLQGQRFSGCLGGVGGNTPVAFPKLWDGEAVVCGLVRYREAPEQLFRCDTLEDMLELYRSYYNGLYSIINWYLAPDLKVITFFRGDTQV